MTTNLSKNLHSFLSTAFTDWNKKYEDFTPNKHQILKKVLRDCSNYDDNNVHKDIDEMQGLVGTR